MKRRFLFFMLIALLNAEHSEAAQDGRIGIEQRGPSDATLRPFAVEIGPLSRSTRDVVYVDAGVFDSLVVIARRSANGMGPFHVTLINVGRPSEVAMDQKGLARLMVPVARMFRDAQVATPPFVTSLAAPE